MQSVLVSLESLTAYAHLQRSNIKIGLLKHNLHYVSNKDQGSPPFSSHVREPTPYAIFHLLCVHQV
jgi:hypothetical protein